MKSTTQRRQVLIACAMVRKELEYLMDRFPFSGEVVWMDKGLHEEPDDLLAALQKEIDLRDVPDTELLLAYGLCGNGVIGLRAEHAHLVIPNFDDCLRALLSEGPGRPVRYNPRALLYTDEWMDREDSLLTQQNKYVLKYGEKKGRKILRLMLKNYEEICFLDTGLYDIDACEETVRPAAEMLSLNITRKQAGIKVYEKLLTGVRDEEILVIPPKEVVSLAHFDTRARCLFED